MTFTIDNENNISAFATPEEAAANAATPFDTFTSEQELAELATPWPAERLVAIWNSLPGVTPVKKFKDRKTAIGRIWARIQTLGAPAQGRPFVSPDSTSPNRSSANISLLGVRPCCAAGYIRRPSGLFSGPGTAKVFTDKKEFR
jgi:hypothetical protein